MVHYNKNSLHINQARTFPWVKSMRNRHITLTYYVPTIHYIISLRIINSLQVQLIQDRNPWLIGFYMIIHISYSYICCTKYLARTKCLRLRIPLSSLTHITWLRHDIFYTRHNTLFQNITYFIQYIFYENIDLTSTAELMANVVPKWRQKALIP